VVVANQRKTHYKQWDFDNKILHNKKQRAELTINRDNIIANAKSRRTFLHEYLDYENK